MKFFLRKRFPIFVLLTLSLIVYNKWFFYLGILTNGDWTFFFKETMSTVRLYYFSLWMGDSFGRVLFDVGQAPTWGMYGILAKFFGFDYALSERLIHFWPVAILTPLSSYLLLRKLFSSKIAIFIGVLVYSFNTYFFVLQTGILTLMAAFSLAPLAILMYMNTLKTLKLKDALFTGLLLFVAGAYEPRALYIIVWVLFFYFLYYIFFIKSNNQKKISSIFIYAGIPILVVGLLNFYWLIGLLKLSTFGPGLAIPIGGGLFGNEFLNMLYGITLYHPFWSGNALTIFTVQQIPSFIWTIPLFAVLGIVLNRKNKHIIFFGVVALIGIFLTKQTAIPFSNAYSFMYKFLPGFSAFREASKFYFLIALGYSVLIAGFIEWLWKNWKDGRFKILAKYFLTITIIFIFLWNTKPLITGNIGSLFVLRQIPKDYLILKDFILKQPDFFRTLGVPISSRFVVSTNSHPEAGWELFDYVNKQTVQEKENSSLLSTSEIRMRLMSKSYSKNLLNISSIKYVLVPNLDVVNDDNLFINYGKSRDYYIAVLNKIPYLKKINIRAKDLIIYENTTYKSLIYLTADKETIYKDIKSISGNINYQFVSPTEYKITLKNISKPLYLNFSESYHPDWKIRIGSFDWWKVLTDKNYFINEKTHIKNDAGLNSYFINPIEVCKVHKVNNVYKVGNGCVRNADGSYDISGTLYFAPQSYMYLGIIISGSTLIIIFGYLGFIGFNSLKRKYERRNK